MEDTVVLGVDTDSVYCHGAFAREQNLQLTLPSDRGGVVSSSD